MTTDAGAWFDEARFGMFIHWDHASQAGLEISWPMVGGVFTLPYGQDVTAAEYHARVLTLRDSAKRLLKDNVAQVAILQLITDSAGRPLEPAAQQQVLVVNTHLSASPPSLLPRPPPPPPPSPPVPTPHPDQLLVRL